MASQQEVLLHEENFYCSICVDLMTDPVTLPCGHNFCCSCIDGKWEKDKRRVRCPVCRHIMYRPALRKNNVLAEVMDVIVKTQLEGARPDDCYAGPGDVACDTCRTGKRKLKAAETCLQCLVSYCDEHVRPHYESPAFKNHKLVKVSGKLHGDICILQVIQEMEEEAKVLQQEGETINRSADRSARNSDTLFAELVSSVERRRSQVREHIRDQQRHEVNRADEQRKRAEQVLAELRRRDAELEQLSRTGEPVCFPRASNTLSTISESTHPAPSSKARPLSYFEDVTVAVSKMRGKLEAILKEEGTNVSDAVNTVDVLLSTAEPTTRAEFLKYALAVTMDPNTTHPFLLLSEGNKMVQNTTVPQGHPPHPKRFGECWQCLGDEALTGRHYWEVEWGGDYVDIATSYPDTPRCADKMERRFGLMKDTWCCQVWSEGASYRHGDVGCEVICPVNSRVGVYLDHPGGIMSFYSVTADAMNLIKRVESIFTRPIFPAFWVSDMATMRMCHDIKKSSED